MYKHTLFQSVMASGLLLFAMAAAQAQTTVGSELPPPDINDPGVTTVPAATTNAPATSQDQLPGTASEAPRDASLPDVNIRTEGDDTVQEYSHNGRIYMIKVIPKNGVPQTYMDTDGDGRLDVNSSKSPVAPVYYTIYEWGKPKPKSDADSGR